MGSADKFLWKKDTVYLFRSGWVFFPLVCPDRWGHQWLDRVGGALCYILPGGSKIFSPARGGVWVPHCCSPDRVVSLVLVAGPQLFCLVTVGRTVSQKRRTIFTGVGSVDQVVVFSGPDRSVSLVIMDHHGPWKQT